MTSSATAVRDTLSDLAAFSLERAKFLGATAAEVEISTSLGQDVTVRLGEVETIEHTRDKGLGITVYIGQKRGNASTTDLSRDAIGGRRSRRAARRGSSRASAFRGLWPLLPVEVVGR
ncbi:MAG: DNA gyrase modulator [Usitatibacteraceae bacterium]